MSNTSQPVKVITSVEECPLHGRSTLPFLQRKCTCDPRPTKPVSSHPDCSAPKIADALAFIGEHGLHPIFANKPTSPYSPAEEWLIDFTGSYFPYNGAECKAVAAELLANHREVLEAAGTKVGIDLIVVFQGWSK